jgi:putative chitinase
MLITLDKLEKCVPQATDRLRIEALEPLNTTLEKYKIDTRQRIAAFLAQITHESGSFRYVEEIASGEAYEYRKDLGNLMPAALTAAHSKGTTTGRFYKGRGWIQITGYYNYKELSKALEVDFVNNPEILCEMPYAALSAGWFWNTHNCNALADVDRFSAITKVINGGYNGREERLRLYRKNLKVLK